MRVGTRRNEEEKVQVGTRRNEVRGGRKIAGWNKVVGLK